MGAVGLYSSSKHQINIVSISKLQKKWHITNQYLSKQKNLKQIVPLNSNEYFQETLSSLSALGTIVNVLVVSMDNGTALLGLRFNNDFGFCWFTAMLPVGAVWSMVTFDGNNEVNFWNFRMHYVDFIQNTSVLVHFRWPMEKPMIPPCFEKIFILFWTNDIFPHHFIH